MAGDKTLITYFVPFVLLFAFLVIRQVRTRNRAFIDVPVVGSSGYFGAFKYIKSASQIVGEGYHKYKNQVFKVAAPDKWLVVVSGPKLVEELRKAPDDELSLDAAVNEFLQVPYTLGQNLVDNPYHVNIIRTRLTRNLSVLADVLRDEIACGFDEILNLQGDDWRKLPAYESIMQVVSRTSNRVFVGLPVCRNPDYIKLSIQFTLDVMTSSTTINLFPQFLHPLVGKYLTTVPRSIRRGLKHLGPIIAERQKYMDEYGKEWLDKPNDMLMWLMEEAQGEEKTPENLTRRMLTLNFVAIHTSSMSFTQALYHLAANPEYVAPMREEVEGILKQEGWSKVSLSKMRKVDSFIRESIRLEGLGATVMERRAVKPYTLSDGTFLPEGTYVCAVGGPMHHDDEVYEDARTFKPFRFADLREKDGEAVKYQSATTSVDYLAFGHGKHACPGRFFAMNEVRAMLAHVLLTYDVKFEKDGLRPESIEFTNNKIPNPKAEIMFRRRQLKSD